MLKKIFILPALLLVAFVVGPDARAQYIPYPAKYWLFPPVEQPARPLRYRPDGEDFVIVNGNRKFTRALYGTNTHFRVETSDVPEFSLMFRAEPGGNLRFSIFHQEGKESFWLNDAAEIESRYRPGKRSYIIRDPRLGEGALQMEVLARGDGEGIILKIRGEDIPADISLSWIFGGISEIRTNRNGDMNADPESVHLASPENCMGNIYMVQGTRFLGQRRDGSCGTLGIFPGEANLRIGDARRQATPEMAIEADRSEECPIMVGSMPIRSGKDYYMTIFDPETVPQESPYNELSGLFDQAEAFRKSIADRIKINTPDPYLNTLGGVLSIAGDAIWEDPSFLHGAIGWRVRLPGWRGAYAGDFLGWHDRARTHFRAYAASQFTEPADKPVIMDTALNLARVAKVMGTPMYSSGYIPRLSNNPEGMNHYDMNLVYLDALLWHLQWTGDLEFAEEMWPVIERHLAWEKLNFDPDDDGLYDAYCCIWASDALQYSGGDVTHATAYNFRANKLAASIAGKIGRDPAPYEAEAEKL